ncbi:hypothetical protein [Paenibacillus sacheonensis]|uniref:Uncharacterized protein n=1 Tax=Paenibacillus sacheonensis TaxID=742054 RepID=A0A7X5C090_9BACL|nr:hypothetical protein [Paenibacillus sacheonensis]MBM7566855.1 ribosome-binding protein aMBF1 (putative translation factor) [Paenibacillus sacheonensis]NBC71477.1 hypothetical protein [Paenibacillus sacheonensis]
MSKPHRGRALWKMPSRGRGTCPVCSAARIKLLYTKNKTDGGQIQVCKRCAKASSDRIDAVN